jgi:formamidopyrimidine-DNA glycosylase
MMLEIPEAAVVSGQLNDTVVGKTVQKVEVGKSPHSFAWYSGEPEFYEKLLTGKNITGAVNHAGMVEIHLQDERLLFSDGVNLRFHANPDEQPVKHQLLLAFTDNSSISASVAMYGGLSCYHVGTFDNPYYQAAIEKPDPLSGEFSEMYFLSLFTPELEKKSLKAFLATEQRIPGFGNGVLQDILYLAGFHPKRKVNTLTVEEKQFLYGVIKKTLQSMIDQGGRDTERDLYGQSGKYMTLMSKNTVGMPCKKCNNTIQKQSYMGGSIYFCSTCQPLV